MTFYWVVFFIRATKFFLNKKCSKNNNASHCATINYQACNGCFNLKPNLLLYNSCVENIAILGVFYYGKMGCSKRA